VVYVSKGKTKGQEEIMKRQFNEPASVSRGYTLPSGVINKAGFTAFYQYGNSAIPAGNTYGDVIFLNRVSRGWYLRGFGGNAMLLSSAGAFKVISNLQIKITFSTAVPFNTIPGTGAPFNNTDGVAAFASLLCAQGNPQERSIYSSFLGDGLFVPPGVSVSLSFIMYTSLALNDQLELYTTLDWGQ
jgi:hypothetical protein